MAHEYDNFKYHGVSKEYQNFDTFFFYKSVYNRITFVFICTPSLWKIWNMHTKKEDDLITFLLCD